MEASDLAVDVVGLGVVLAGLMCGSPVTLAG